ncbi:hypothetical protein B0T17DRAFT_617160 [Bombardia bombarda]|uniref:F-box domain-containing protein n=1 Tax=Bombardia bombarda TaxID=252184 RepID=A0AA40C5H3_9PEZI|nr:hypothetical protein B0T17DRAFT_617160 [Bombardia bombarda]
MSATADKDDSLPGQLNYDTWHLILGYIEDRKDLCSLSLVSKKIHNSATPHLYRTLLLGPRQRRKSSFAFGMRLASRMSNTKQKLRDAQWRDTFALIRRLVTNPDGQQAHAVREVEVVVPERGEEYAVRQFEHPDKGLAAQVRALPGLRQVRPQSALTPALDDALLRALSDHPNRPRLHLLDEDGHRAVAGPMPCVSVICARVNPYHDTEEKANRTIPAIQELVFSCPNLKSLALCVVGNYGGCMRPPVYHPQVYSFRLVGDETFPPLESLSLDGYRMGSDYRAPEEWPHWRDRLDWSRLRALGLGPQPMHANILEYVAGYATALRSLTVQTYAEEGEDLYPQLEAFLLSFGSLEELNHFANFGGLGRADHHVWPDKNNAKTFFNQCGSGGTGGDDVDLGLPLYSAPVSGGGGDSGGGGGGAGGGSGGGGGTTTDDTVFIATNVETWDPTFRS